MAAVCLGASSATLFALAVVALAFVFSCTAFQKCNPVIDGSATLGESLTLLRRETLTAAFPQGIAPSRGSS